MTGFLIAVLSGTLMSVQGVFNTQVTKTAGMWVSNGCMAGNGKKSGRCTYESRAEIFAPRRRDRCRDHVDGD